MKSICDKNKEDKKDENKQERKSDSRSIEIQKIFHSCFLIKYPDGVTVLTDPYYNNSSLGNLKIVEENKSKKEDLPKIDIVLVSHEHFDHFDKEVIQYLITRDQAIVIGPQDVTKQLNIPKNHERTVKIDDEFIVATVKITVLSAQHHQSFYPVGYLLEKGGQVIYFAGDTNSLPNISKHVNIAIMPSGGVFTADLFEFISMTRQLKCEHAIPMHYNTFDLIKIDTTKLRTRCDEKLKNCQIDILKDNDKLFIDLE